MAHAEDIALTSATPIARSDNTGTTIVEANSAGRYLRSRLERGKMLGHSDNEG